MDELERQLRTTLADDRLALTPRPDALAVVRAGVRRRRRARVASAAAAVVVIAAGTAAAVTQLPGDQRNAPIPPIDTGPTLSPTPSPTTSKPPLPPAQLDEVRWTGDAYDYRHPPAFPGAIADSAVPWCRADQLSLTSAWQGATGDLAGVVTVVNTSTTMCAVQGQPAVAITAGTGHDLVTSTPEPFYVDAWIRLRPAGSASAHVTWLQEFCREPAPATVAVSLPHAGGTLTAPMTQTPRCNVATDPPSAGRLDVDGFVAAGDETFTSEAALQASIDRAAKTVVAGGVLHYRLQLQSMGSTDIALDPCLPFRERLTSADGAHVYEGDYLLNCGEAPATIDTPQSNRSTYFDMQLTVPADAVPGDYQLRWQSVLKPVFAVPDDVVRILPAPPPCRDGQLTASAGRGGAAAGTYYRDIVFRNISGMSCSLFGYPGVQLSDARGNGVATRVGHGVPATPHLVVLARNGYAAATVAVPDAGPDGGRTPCATSAGVLVIPPGMRQQLLVPAVSTRCYDSVTVWPVVEGTRGSLGG